MKGDHSPIFDHFVKLEEPEGHQLQGLIAYALYKRSKREWAGRKSERPSQDQLNAYVETWTKTRLDGLNEQAERLLDGFVSAYVEAADPVIRAEALKGTFWRAVWPGMMSALLYSLGLIIIAIILHYSGVDILELLHKIGAETK